MHTEKAWRNFKCAKNTDLEREIAFHISLKKIKKLRACWTREGTQKRNDKTVRISEKRVSARKVLHSRIIPSPKHNVTAPGSIQNQIWGPITFEVNFTNRISSGLRSESISQHNDSVQIRAPTELRRESMTLTHPYLLQLFCFWLSGHRMQGVSHEMNLFLDSQNLKINSDGRIVCLQLSLPCFSKPMYLITVLGARAQKVIYSSAP